MSKLKQDETRKWEMEKLLFFFFFFLFKGCVLRYKSEGANGPKNAQIKW